MRHVASSSWSSGSILWVAFCAFCISGCGPEVRGGPIGTVSGGNPQNPDPPHVDLTPPPCDRPVIEDMSAFGPFERLVYGFAGHYRGMANPPVDWGIYEEYPVDVTFFPSGHYKADCLWPDCTAFYYGSNNDVAEKTYEIDDLLDDGTGVASIRISFDDTGGSVTTGTLREIVLTEDMQGLTFEFFPTWSGTKGPIVYDLKCSVP
jgi:hypothetical protein